MKFYTNFSQQKDILLEIGYENGKRFMKPAKYKPYLFLPTKGQSEYRTHTGLPVEKKFFNTISQANSFLWKYKDIHGFTYYGSDMWMYSYLNEQYPDEIEYDQNLIKVAYIDIETSSRNGFPKPDVASEEVTAITLIRKDQVYIFGLKPFNISVLHNNPKIDKTLTYHYEYCMSETELLEKFLLRWQDYDDIISGWYIEHFDIPYLVNRITNILGAEEAKKLSPWRKLTARSFDMFGKKTTVYIPDGISVLDYQDLYKKFVQEPRESYSLNYISYVDLDEEKLDYSEFSSLDELFDKDHDKFISYNVQDTILVKKLDQKRDLIGLVITMAYDAKVNFADILGTVKPWDAIITNSLMKEKIVVRSPPRTDFPQIAGAYVKTPIIGMHECVISFDLTSLYPMLMMMYNISPETFVTKINSIRFDTIDQIIDEMYTHPEVVKWKAQGCNVTANLCVFSKDKVGFIPRLVEERFKQRDVYKKQMNQAKEDFEKSGSIEDKNRVAKYSNAEKAKKIQINALYGALANKYFRWADPNLAQSITLSGQVAIRWIERKLNEFLNDLCKTTDYDYVVAVDTDSVYLRLKNLIPDDCPNVIDELDRLGQEVIRPFIDQSYAELGELVAAHRQTMYMKREAIGDRAVWMAKKRYVMNVHALENIRFKTPELKIMGSEAIRSSTPEMCREFIKESYKYIIRDDLDGLRKLVKDYYQEYQKKRFDEIAFPRSVNGMTKYADAANVYKKGTPIAVRGALQYNKLIKEKGLSLKYRMIHEGDKIKFCYLKIPNPTKEDVISVPHILPEEFGLESYIDYWLQFEKSFISPIDKITQAIGWEIKPRVTLPI